MNKKLIELTEILWPEKGSTEFRYRTITVSVDKIKYFGGCELTLSAPLEIACKIFRGEIPKQYYREVGKKICTTIYFTDGTEVNVKETSQEINKILEMPSRKSAWSEEDEQLYNDLSDTYFYNDEDYPEETYKLMLKRVLDWMTQRAKSLKPQNEWKPSEEMLKALYRVIPENVMDKSEDEILLDKLYQGLKYGKVLSEK